MSQFPDARHLASWAGLCPGNSESAGKRFSGRTRKGDRYLRRMLVQNAWAVPVAHRILRLAYYILRDGTEYREAGGDFYDRRNPTKTAKRLARRLERIGFEVTPKPRDPQRKPGLPPGQRCKRCNAWGIPCIHIRPRIASPPDELSD